MLCSGTALKLPLPVRPEDHLDDHGSNDSAQGHQQLDVHANWTNGAQQNTRGMVSSIDHCQGLASSA
jgi:hypothetical protein